MTEIKLSIEANLNVEEIIKYQEILVALVSCGGLSGVKSGQTIIHFDKEGVFKGVQLSYWPWRKRPLDKQK
uniref:Uncharacterized protein n=1 Tax=viral metagenome TaxID=1070528 RepID=A0A6H1ZSL3_9ZZZZ